MGDSDTAHILKFDVWAWSLSLKRTRLRTSVRRKFNLNFRTCWRKTPASREKKNTTKIWIRLLHLLTSQLYEYTFVWFMWIALYKGNISSLCKSLLYLNKSYIQCAIARQLHHGVFTILMWRKMTSPSVAKLPETSFLYLETNRYTLAPTSPYEPYFELSQPSAAMVL